MGSRDRRTLKPARPVSSDLPLPSIRRLPIYLRNLEELHRVGRIWVPSTELASLAGVSHDVVRRDLWYLQATGVRGRGYSVEKLLGEVARALGLDRSWPIVVIGIGRLGGALVRYGGLRASGFRVVAGFDNDPAKLGALEGGVRIHSMNTLATVVRDERATIAVISTPAEAAQAVAAAAISSGISAILNFAPVVLRVPPTVNVRQVDVASELEMLAYDAWRRELERSGRTGKSALSRASNIGA